MPQQTNLNVAPYFDDFEASNDFHKVLFKPGYPVQARELTTLQSILQNQIEKFGQHFFKEGSKVIPGNIGYTQLYKCVQLNNTFQGVPVEAYAEQLVGTKITGKSSGVTAVVDKVLLSDDSDRGNLTLYINYLNSSTTNNSTETFSDAEELSSDTTITSGLLGNNSIAAGDSLAVTFATNASATGSAFQIQEGIYFIRGNFINVSTETLILDQYSNTPSYRIGLYVNEEIINADLDESLNDNSQGYNNFSAPGADRLRITTSLFKKPLDDFDDNNFVELGVVDNGTLRSLKRNAEYNELADELARRTYDESGDYYVKPFDVEVKNSLNDLKGNRGIFQAGQFTYGGETPAESLAQYKIAPGKAYVRGYEVETIAPTFLDVEKPRTTNTVEDNKIIYNTGPTLRLNRAFGNPTVGIGNTYVVSLRDRRVGSTQTQAQGGVVGVARVYDYALESGSYDASNADVNQWDIALYDVQMVTDLTVNTAQTLTVPTYIEGQNSGATGFLKDAVTAGTGVTVYETNGDFIPNEKLNFIGGNRDGAMTQYGTATIKSVQKYTISDVKSLYGSLDGTIGINTFSADVVPSTKFSVGVATITPYAAAGVATVTSANPNLVGLSTVGNLISYTGDSTDPVYGRITAVDGDNKNITVTTVTAVTGVNAALGSDLVADGSGNGPTVSDLKVLQTNLQNSSDNTLYTPLPRPNISNVDLTSATIPIRKTFDVQILNNQITASTTPTAGANETFLPFDEERYSLVREDGSTETLTSDRVVISTAGDTFQAYNLADNGSAAVAEKATLIATLEKSKPTAKVKVLNRVNSVVIDKSNNKASGTGTTTLNDGLTYGNYPYGTRVQDKVISLNTPDIIEIHGVYEASDADTGSTLSAPKVTLTSITSSSTTTAEYIIGEEIIGQTSDAVAIVAEKVANSATQIAYIYKNENRFLEGETIKSQESKINAQVVTLTTPSFNIGSEFKFTTGQEKTIYNVGTITRKNDADAPQKKLRVYFSNGYYESTDDGDLTTVNSYDTFNYATQIKTIDNVRNSDILDIRPRVSDFTNSEGQRSPLEFYGRSFDASGNSAANILASDESLLTTFSYYQGRIDRIFLTKAGVFQVKYGQPSDRPEKPLHVEEAIEIATVTLPPYLYFPSDASIQFLDYKRYQMRDIKKLEDRIKSLEFYTALSLLETNTANLFVPDSDGLNRFKSGFFVDNFSSFRPQEDRIPINNSIDPKYKELRPRHYTNSVDLIFGPVVNVDTSEDLSNATIEGNNVRKNNDVVTLDYSEVEYIKQSFATRSESVTPFLISFWQGSMELTPASDTWVDTVRLDAKIIEVEGNYQATMSNLALTEGVDPQTGLGPTVWNSWETTWTGRNVTETTRTRTNLIGWVGQGAGGDAIKIYGDLTTQVIEDRFRQVTETGIESRAGSQTVVTEQWDTTSVGDRVVSRDMIAYMRARNVTFDAKRMKPLTRMYGFFDGQDITKYCVPKLLEVTMDSGTFTVGETVIGQVLQVGTGEQNTDSTASITFRVAQQNHKEGDYNAPTKTYVEDPYNNRSLGATYSSTSTVLNIDLYSLAQEAQGDFFGWVQQGMILTGKTSGAQATINNVRLVSDLAADIQGSIYIPNPNNFNHPRFETGTKVFTLVNDENNDQDNASTIGEETFTSSGTLETVQENIVSVRNARVEQKQQFQERNVSRDLGTELVGSTVISETTQENVIVGWYDPLAQSFLVEDSTGVFLTSCDVFFRTKDDGNVPCVFQLRSMKNGYPTQHILPFSEIVLSPDEITTSSDGSIATTITFKAPVYCEPNQEYAIALASNSTKYSVYISRIGENDLLSQTYISNQPYLGSLFKSQNASTWEASQWEDLKFTLYRADFLENGTVETYNPELTKGNNQIAKLMPNPLSLTARKQRLALDQSISDGDIRFGNTITQTESLASANYVGSAGTATGDLGILNAGIGYTPSSGQVTYSGVNLVTVTGNGHGATADITIGNGVIVASGATIASGSAGGNGYMIGDVVGIDTLGSGPFKNIGANARLSIAGIGSTSEIIVDDVQGTFNTGAGYTMTFANNAGITTELNWAVGGGGVQLDTVDTESDGLHIKVNHKNHGMYFSDNSVIISEVVSDIKPTKLTTAYDVGSTGTISVQSASDFSTFEQVGVGTTNVGFLQIGEEVIEYTNVAGNAIGGNIVRGANPSSYPVGTPVYKYELGGVNLARINKTHALSDVTIDDPITYDSYNVKLDMSEILDSTSANTNRSLDQGFAKLFIADSKSTGGFNVRATQNMPYEVIVPSVQNVSVPATTLEGEIRTTSSRSLSGSEIPWVEVGYETVAINQNNYLDTARCIASKVNADNKLTTLPGNKSFSLRLNLGTTDSRVSPVIDGQRISAVLTSSRVNDVISDYATDERVNGLFTDPTACQYISKEIQLENGASSLKVLLAAHINKDCDIRAFYAINDQPGFSPIFVPFPGYQNLDDNGEVIAIQNNNGQSDKLVVDTNTYGFDSAELVYKDYTFTADQLPGFRCYRIKIVMTSTNQVYVPRMKDLRVIALA